MKKVNFQQQGMKTKVVAVTTQADEARGAKGDFSAHPTNSNFVQVKPRDRANFHFKSARDKNMAK